MATRTESTPRPLLVTDDTELLDECLRLADHCGISLDVAPDPASARSRYPVAPLVLIGSGVASACVRARFPLRRGVILVGFESPEETDPPWRLADALGVEEIAFLPGSAEWLVERLAKAMGIVLSDAGRIVAILGGRGGAGASVLAAGLAVTAARAGHRALLVDTDRLSGGIDLVLGWEDLGGLRWPGLAETSGPVNPPALVEALPQRGDLAVVSWDRGEMVGLPSASLQATLEAGQRSRELVVVDLPRTLDNGAELALVAADRAFLVVPAELRACAAAARVVKLAVRHTEALEVIVREPAPGGLDAKDIARAVGLPLAGTLRTEPRIVRDLEHGAAPAGSGRGSLAVLCRRLIEELRLDRGGVAA